jgi:hypothetical protein
MSRCRKLTVAILTLVLTAFVLSACTVPLHADQAALILKRTRPSWGGETAASRYPAVIVSNNRLLLPVGDTLYLIDSQHRILWKWACTAPLSTSPIIIGDAVYGACYDLITYKLDLNTGTTIWADEANGRVTFANFQRYKDRFYLVVTLMAEYEDSEDVLTLHDSHNDTVVWEKRIPGGADVQVWGDQILAVMTSVEGIEIRQIQP